MCGHTTDPARFKEISRRFGDYLPSSRPDILGGIGAFAAEYLDLTEPWFDSA